MSDADTTTQTARIFHQWRVIARHVVPTMSTAPGSSDVDTRSGAPDEAKDGVNGVRTGRAGTVGSGLSLLSIVGIPEPVKEVGDTSRWQGLTFGPREAGPCPGVTRPTRPLDQGYRKDFPLTTLRISS